MKNKLYHLYILIFTAVLVWSGIHPKDRATWLLEVFPALIAFAVLLITYRKFQFTPLVYFLILVHSIILMVGGHYTYAEVPLFDWIGQVMHWQRNNYDKVGHLAQGFIPAMIARELLLRKSPLQPGKWLNFIVVCICMTISAVYELIEWAVALTSGQAAEAFLGTQGYIWDTQSDMLMALIGAVLALVLLSRVHDRQLEKV